MKHPLSPSQQLNSHPLRGAIFESWMVSEVAKARVAAGLARRMFHYRESRGPEVDLLVQGETSWILAEAKSWCVGAGAGWNICPLPSPSGA